MGAVVIILTYEKDIDHIFAVELLAAVERPRLDKILYRVGVCDIGYRLEAEILILVNGEGGVRVARFARLIVDEREYLADICAAQRRENKHKAYDNAQQRLQIALVVTQKEGLEFISHEVD